MVGVRFISADGDEKDLDIAAGVSVMEGAVRGGIDGIDADCGGELSCATCHVHIGADWMDKIPPATEDEKDMLEYAIDTDDTSRLSCQIFLNAELDGLVVKIPERQS